MFSVVADTLIIVWFLNDPAKLSNAANTALTNSIKSPNDTIFVSAISLIELQYLVEKRRIAPSILNAVLSEINNVHPIFEIVPVDQYIATDLAKVSRSDVPDMPDRIIAVTALSLQLPLVTADGAIRSSGISVIW